MRQLKFWEMVAMAIFLASLRGAASLLNMHRNIHLFCGVSGVSLPLNPPAYLWHSFAMLISDFQFRMSGSHSDLLIKPIE